MGTIFNLQRYSLHDGPGIRTTVFLKGCPLKCRWCHNPESQAFGPELLLFPDRCTGCGACLRVCPHEAVAEKDGRLWTDRTKCRSCGSCAGSCPAQARVLTGREAPAPQIMAEIAKDQVFYDESGGGATFSGGEPLAQPDFLRELLAACRERGIHTAVETCGFAASDTLLEVIRYTDLFLYDLKVLDDARHREYTGVSNRVILQNLELVAARGARVIVRVPLVPGVNDSAAHTQSVGRFLAALPGLRQVDLLPYHHTGRAKYERLGRVYPLEAAAPLTEEVVRQTGEILEGYGLIVRVGGLT